MARNSQRRPLQFDVEIVLERQLHRVIQRKIKQSGTGQASDPARVLEIDLRNRPAVWYPQNCAAAAIGISAIDTTLVRKRFISLFRIYGLAEAGQHQRALAHRAAWVDGDILAPLEASQNFQVDSVIAPGLDPLKVDAANALRFPRRGGVRVRPRGSRPLALPARRPQPGTADRSGGEGPDQRVHAGQQNASWIRDLYLSKQRPRPGVE